MATERRMALDLQPETRRAGSAACSTTTSSPPRRASDFEELVEELRREMADTFFEGASEALSNMDPEQMQRMRDAYDALNQMLEQRERGEELDPSFEQFMEQFGDMFPGEPENLDELLEQLASAWPRPGRVELAQPRAAGQLRSSWTSVLEDMDLRWQVERLAQNLQRAGARRRLAGVLQLQGEGPMGLNRGHRPGHPAGPARPHGGHAAVGLHPGRAG